MTTKTKVGRSKKSIHPSQIESVKLGSILGLLKLGYTVKKACKINEIPSSTYYDLLKRYKSFSEEHRCSREYPNIKARELVLKSIEDGNVKSAMWWLERFDLSRADAEEDRKIDEEELAERRKQARERVAKWRRLAEEEVE